jgi:catechol 2,3-dioxygenase-like lactoylglutathione lyase family enzyme
MLHHVSLGTNDLARAKSFYDPLMEYLGLRCIKQSNRIVAYGLTAVLFSLERPVNQRPATAGNGIHVAFHAGHRNTVRACYEAGLANGGTDDGAPGVRTQYDPHYYAAFLRDPDGNKIEIVTFAAD